MYVKITYRRKESGDAWPWTKDIIALQGDVTGVTRYWLFCVLEFSTGAFLLTQFSTLWDPGPTLTSSLHSCVLTSSYVFLIFCFLEIKSQRSPNWPQISYIAEDKMTLNPWSSCSYFPSAGTTDVYHYALFPCFHFNFLFCVVLFLIFVVGY